MPLELGGETLTLCISLRTLGWTVHKDFFTWGGRIHRWELLEDLWVLTLTLISDLWTVVRTPRLNPNLDTSAGILQFREFWRQCGHVAVGGGCRYLREGPGVRDKWFRVRAGRRQPWPADLSVRKCPVPPCLVCHITLSWESQNRIQLRMFLSSLCCLSPSVRFLLLPLCWFCAFSGPVSGRERKGRRLLQALTHYVFQHPKIQINLLMKIREKEAFVMPAGLLVIKWLYSFDCWNCCWHIKSHEMWGCVNFDRLISFQYYRVWKCLLTFSGEKHVAWLLWKRVAF